MRMLSNKKILPYVICLLTAITLSACAAPVTRHTFTRDIGIIDYSAVKYTPWDVGAASARVPAQNKRDYTVMIYMNGSDLESEIGAGTTDLIEMLESGLHSENANVVIFTGGTIYWQNDIIPADECAIWYIKDGELFEKKRVGLLNMGDPDTLADFISFAMDNFPAEKYGLILWDHGGGAIAGFGHDEKFKDYDGSLTLPEMDYALKKTGLSGQKLEWLGFDSCLMATVEMAHIASQYARYLIASEDLEPGDGWDYKFLGFLNDNPHACGYSLGREIVDTFMDFYGPYSDEILTLSVTDLDKVQPVMETMGALMRKCSDKLILDGFPNLAKRRRHTKTFGEGSPRDNESDMVDIGDMALQLSDLFPSEAAAVHVALNDAVLYNRHNSLAPIYGLSSYYVYGGLFYDALEQYAELDMDEAYVEYILEFFDLLSEREPEYDIPTFRYIMGMPAYLYKTTELRNRTRYSAPAQVNGEDCDILFCQNGSKLNVLGYRCYNGLVKQKGYEFFKPGDMIAFFYPSDSGWQLGPEVENPLFAEQKSVGEYLSPTDFLLLTTRNDACGSNKNHSSTCRARGGNAAGHGLGTASRNRVHRRKAQIGHQRIHPSHHNRT